MENRKLKEVQVDNRIARLREKNKMLEERHKMLEDEKRQAQAQSSKQNDDHLKNDNQRFKAHMDKPNESFKKHQPAAHSRQFSNSKISRGRGYEGSHEKARQQHHKDDSRRSASNRFYKGAHHRHEDTPDEDHKNTAPKFTNPLLSEDSDQPFHSGRKNQPGNARGMKKYNNPRKTEKKEQPTQSRRNDEDHQRWVQQRELADHERMQRFQNKGQRDWDNNKSNNTDPWGDSNRMSSHYQHDSRDADRQEDDRRSEPRYNRNKEVQNPSHHGGQQQQQNRGGEGGHHTPRGGSRGGHRGGRGGGGHTPSSEVKSSRNITDHDGSGKEGGDVEDLRVKLNQMRTEKSQDDSTTKKKTRQQHQRRRNRSSNHDSLSESSSTGPQYGNTDSGSGKTLNHKDGEVFEEQHQQDVVTTSSSIDHLLDDTPDVTDWALEVEMNSPSYQNKQFNELHGEEHNNEWHPASFENLSISVSDKGKKETRRVTGKSGGQH